MTKTKTKTRPPGRPVRSDQSSSVELRVRVTPEELAAYRARAEAVGVTLSDWVRGRLGT